MKSDEEVVNEMFQECTTNERINFPMFVTLMSKVLRMNELEAEMMRALETLDTRKSGNMDVASFVQS